MQGGKRTVVYDSRLMLEAYRLEGVSCPFPNHFHEYYVVGLTESGERRLRLGDGEYVLRRGDILLLNPGDSHSCVQSGGALDYRGINIPAETMRRLAESSSGRDGLPLFASPVISDGETARRLRSFHEEVMCGRQDEESLLMLLSSLPVRYGGADACAEEHSPEAERAYGFIKEHYAEHICLDDICRHAGASKSALLRAFARERGITPCLCLQNIRVSRAKELLALGIPPAETALRTGFFDQSHFTNCFRRITGLTPGAYFEIFKKETQTDAGAKMRNDN